MPGHRVVYIPIIRRDVEITHNDQAGIVAQFAIKEPRDLGEPVQLVGIFLAADGLAIDHIQVGDAHVANRGDEDAPLRIVQPGQVGDDIMDLLFRQHRHAVVGLLTGESDLISQRLDRGTRELCILHLGFLDAEQVGPRRRAPLLYMRQAHIQRIDIPGGQYHSASLADWTHLLQRCPTLALQRYHARHSGLHQATMNTIDLRSDTVTQPTPAMREAMMVANVGDDVYGEDPTVRVLEERLAAELGFDCGLFVPSGTQANLVALLVHCQRGDEVLVGMEAHTYKYETGGAAVLGSIQPQPVPNASDGSLPLEALAKALKPDDQHFARTRLLALENTWHGRVLPQHYILEAAAWARSQRLATHLDGARFFNAVVATGKSPRELAKPFDTVSLCLSKGLGAPVGSVLLCSESALGVARRWRKMLGGGMRQSGILAAAGLYALDHHVARLADDHARAERLAAGLRAIDSLVVQGCFTNMVFIDIPSDRLRALDAHLTAAGVRASIGYLPSVRLVTHLDIDDAAIEKTIETFARFFT